MAALDLQVPEEDGGKRLDVVLAKRVPSLGRARAKALIARGAVRVGGRLVKKSHVVAAGDCVTVDVLPVPSDFDAAPDPEVDLQILFENADFVVVEKPAGMPSHPLRPEERETLAGGLLARYPEMRGVGYRRREPGILHRLDTGTSGVMLAARNAEAFRSLRDELRAGRIEKRYLARCLGTVEAPAAIDTPIANDPRDRRKARACAVGREAKRLGGRSAHTEILASMQAPHGSLVELRVNHARRHQIRVHLASIGHPLLGDTLYGGPALQAPTHHLLHASSIRVGTVRVNASVWKFYKNELTIDCSG